MARYCEYCGRPLVIRFREEATKFLKRRTCGNRCAGKLRYLIFKERLMESVELFRSFRDDQEFTVCTLRNKSEAVVTAIKREPNGLGGIIFDASSHNPCVRVYDIHCKGMRTLYFQDIKWIYSEGSFWMDPKLSIKIEDREEFKRLVEMRLEGKI